MHGRASIAARFVFIAALAPLAACSTMSDAPPAPGAAARTDAPVPSSGGSLPSFLSAPVRSVDSSLAQPCIAAAANKYFLPEKAISAVGSRPGANGGTDVDLKVDLRTAVCQVSKGGGVRGVYDTSPKSADQIAAEAAAAKGGDAATAPKKVRKAKKTVDQDD